MMNFLIVIFKFSVAGFFGVLINFIITFILKEKLKFHKYISNTIGISLALIINFICNKFWTYNNYNTIIYNEIIKFISVIIVSIILNHLIVYYFNNIKKIRFYYSKIIAVIVLFVWNFIMHTYYTFN